MKRKMKDKVHLIAATLATLCIATFFTSTILVELFGTPNWIATVKGLIVSPGLFILIPTMAITAATGFTLSKTRKGQWVTLKKKRMPYIGANGLLILIPAAIFLDHLATEGAFNVKFYIIQGVELLAGGINLFLMGMNMRDGLKMKGKRRH